MNTEAQYKVNEARLSINRINHIAQCTDKKIPKERLNRFFKLGEKLSTIMLELDDVNEIVNELKL